MICNRLDVVLVPFPFMDLPVTKRRPALVLSGADFNADNGHSVLAMITTAKGSAWPSDYRLKNPREAGLVEDCYVRWKTFTLSNELIVSRLGGLADPDRDGILAGMRSVFAA